MMIGVRRRMLRPTVRCRANSSFAAAGAGAGGAGVPDGLPVRVLVSESTDALLNLAAEEYLFRDAPTAHTLFLWRNDKSVIVGRNQNVWKECHIDAMEELGVQLARRGSGGGAVYQDLGNTCFTLLSPIESYSVSRNVELLLGALRRVGVEAEASGRNDLLVDGRKISGSAFKQNQRRAFHHGTLLVDVDGAAMQRVLNPNKAKLLSKGVASVQQRVLNLRSAFPHVDHETLCAALEAEFAAAHGAAARVPVERLSEAAMRATEPLMRYHARLSDWQWRFGANPDFEHHFSTRFDALGAFDVHLDVRRSLVSAARVFSDSLRPALPEQLARALVGVRYDRAGIERAAARTALLLADGVGADYLDADAAPDSAALDARVAALGGSLAAVADAAALPDDDRRTLALLADWLGGSL